jgi:hypothetical protein
MEHNSSRVVQTAKKFPSLFETLQVISFQYHLPATSFLRIITHIHTLNSYFFKIHIRIILPSVTGIGSLNFIRSKLHIGR